MSIAQRKKPSASPSPSKPDFGAWLARSAQAAVVFLGLTALLFILQAGSFLLIPVTLAVVVGLMLSPIALQLEKRGMPSGLASVVCLLLFVLVIGSLAAALAAPLAAWAARVPQIWAELQIRLTSLSEPLATIRNLREEIRNVTGESGVAVAVEDGSTMESVALIAPALLAQLLIFLASLYFFIATRQDTRLAILKMCPGRDLRWRVSHIFRDVEELVSNYLLSITIINIGLGLAVGLALWLIGVPSAPLWGALAGALNFIMYIGPAVVAALLFGVGLTGFQSFAGSFLPPLVYLALNALEAQFVTPTVVGKRLTLNPFLVFLAISFWIWMWGPVGGFIAIPALLIVFAVARNVIPGFNWGLTHEKRRRYSRLP